MCLIRFKLISDPPNVCNHCKDRRINLHSKNKTKRGKHTHIGNYRCTKMCKHFICKVGYLIICAY